MYFFRMEYEMSMRQTVEADVARLRKLLDDTNVTRLHLESDIESLKEELITLKKNHLTVRGASQKLLARMEAGTWPDPARRQDSDSKTKKTPTHSGNHSLSISPLNRMLLNCVPRSAPWVSTWMLTLPKAKTSPRSWRRCGRIMRG